MRGWFLLWRLFLDSNVNFTFWHFVLSVTYFQNLIHDSANFIWILLCGPDSQYPRKGVYIFSSIYVEISRPFIYIFLYFIRFNGNVCIYTINYSRKLSKNATRYQFRCIKAFLTTKSRKTSSFCGKDASFFGIHASENIPFRFFYKAVVLAFRQSR